MENMVLRGKMAEKGVSQRDLAQKIPMSENSLAAKIKGLRSFKVTEVIAICRILEISDPAEQAHIFFAAAVSKNETTAQEERT